MISTASQFARSRRRMSPCWAVLAPLVVAASSYSAPLATITVEETAQLVRGRWPIIARVPIDRAAAERAALVDAQDKAVPFQVLDVSARQPEDPPAPEVDLCFFVELQPQDVRRYTLREGEGPPATAVTGPRIQYEGEGFGPTIDTGPATFRFDPRSGQLLTYAMPESDGALPPRFFRQGDLRPIHWNPDVWAPPRTWGHTSDWDAQRPERRPLLTVSRGALAYRLVRSGIMPTSNGVATTVSYTMFAGMPFIHESSSMRFTADTPVKAVRNNELVFSRGIHTHAVWAAAPDTPAVKPIFDKQNPKRFFGRVAELPADVPWLGLFHDEHRYGIAVVNFEDQRTAPAGSAGPRDEGAHYYFLDYGEHGTGKGFDMNFAYLCRALISRYNGPPVTVPRGATYTERSAFLTFRVGEDDARRFDDLLRWITLLRHPPTVTVK